MGTELVRYESEVLLHSDSRRRVYLCRHAPGAPGRELVGDRVEKHARQASGRWYSLVRVVVVLGVWRRRFSWDIIRRIVLEDVEERDSANRQQGGVRL